ncbi:hypothetical protein SAMN05443270_0160 [Lacrimispora sphenoides]|jgi:hypothetical protein|uniref:hypothetical protein n=1 Tax=Lacrimispora sphenoides TaxID=29370 RepID=UPI0008C09B3D|nr:hypothetical protein [Lacrimispora sphenoides]SET46561.1 hypothetical protein SAMN05443270_0160 [Lacrimispora sphenoides]
MIKLHSLLIIVILFISLTGCTNTFQSTSEKKEQNQTLEYMTQQPHITDNTDKNIPTALSDEDFIVKNKDTFIELRSSYENLITNEEISYISYLNEDHVFDTYVYENFIVSVSPANNTVFSINLVTPELKTSRGIGVGNSISDIAEKYGLDDETYDRTLVYHYDFKMLIFYVDKDGIITNIVLEMI